MSNPESKEPRIIVDDDWKAEARREKQEADRKTKDASPHGQLPAPALAEVVQMIVVQASIGFGGMQDPQTGQQMPPSLPLAKHYIDLLELLQKKTQGNLDQDEQRLIDGTLHELRLAFVQVAGAAAPPPAGAEKKA